MRYFLMLFVIIGFQFGCDSAFAQKGCAPRLWDHVYDKEWLRIKEYCITVKGTIYNEYNEDNGNVHIRLLLDRGQDSMLTEKNISEQLGCLVVTPICVGPISLPDAMGPCSELERKISIPKQGTHVKVKGIFVYNMRTGYNEIHPATSITVIP